MVSRVAVICQIADDVSVEISAQTTQALNNVRQGACGNCSAELTVSAQQRTVTCPYCDTPSVVDVPKTHDAPEPVFVIGFAMEQEQAQQQVKSWIRSKAWWARSGFSKATAEKTRGVYVPAYLYGAELHSQYSVQIGETYTETYTTADAKGNRRTRRRTRTEWRKLAGAHAAHVTDRIVTASRGIDNEALQSIEPFDLSQLARYRPSMIAGWYAEAASLQRDSCVRLARDEAKQDVARRLADFMPGDKHRDLRFSSQFDNEHIEPMLVPVWVFSVRYRDDRDPLVVWVNGQSGRLHGRVPYSGWKIGFAIAAGIALLGLAIWGVAG